LKTLTVEGSIATSIAFLPSSFPECTLILVSAPPVVWFDLIRQDRFQPFPSRLIFEQNLI
jgi:hypothetical protein